MPRMKILNSLKQTVFEAPPVFNSAERKRCFDSPVALQDIATSLRTETNQLVFLLSCGYFKATKRFYRVQSFHLRDLTYVADRAATVLETVNLGSGASRDILVVLMPFVFRPSLSSMRAPSPILPSETNHGADGRDRRRTAPCECDGRARCRRS
jgi:hypothetical protein